MECCSHIWPRASLSAICSLDRVQYRLRCIVGYYLRVYSLFPTGETSQDLSLLFSFQWQMLRGTIFQFNQFRRIQLGMSLYTEKNHFCSFRLSLVRIPLRHLPGNVFLYCRHSMRGFRDYYNFNLQDQPLSLQTILISCTYLLRLRSDNNLFCKDLPCLALRLCIEGIFSKRISKY